VVGIAEEEMTDASGKWTYVLEDGGATIMYYVEEPRGYLVIPDELDGFPVTGIDSWVFYKCGDLTRVTIPDGVISIGLATFQNCERLFCVTIPDSVTCIEIEAFSGCEKLQLLVNEGSTAEEYAKEFSIPFVYESSQIVVEDDYEGWLDASGQWIYVLAYGGARIWSREVEPRGDLVIPGELGPVQNFL
jgi:hypothetical protein